MGGIFAGWNFRGGNFRGWNFRGWNFRGWNFPGTAKMVKIFNFYALCSKGVLSLGPITSQVFRGLPVLYRIPHKGGNKRKFIIGGQQLKAFFLFGRKIISIQRAITSQNFRGLAALEPLKKG